MDLAHKLMACKAYRCSNSFVAGVVTGKSLAMLRLSQDNIKGALFTDLAHNDLQSL